ncbi:MAG: hypothetical protein NTZ48_00580 [Candidatus Omnitrophica bacterium]|nr:hypothetical protein [Candidatus Omnitrophota bacterium]
MKTKIVKGVVLFLVGVLFLSSPAQARRVKDDTAAETMSWAEMMRQDRLNQDVRILQYYLALLRAAFNWESPNAGGLINIRFAQLRKTNPSLESLRSETRVSEDIDKTIEFLLAKLPDTDRLRSNRIEAIDILVFLIPLSSRSIEFTDKMLSVPSEAGTIDTIFIHYEFNHFMIEGLTALRSSFSEPGILSRIDSKIAELRAYCNAINPK